MLTPRSKEVVGAKPCLMLCSPTRKLSLTNSRTIDLVPSWSALWPSTSVWNPSFLKLITMWSSMSTSISKQKITAQQAPRYTSKTTVCALIPKVVVKHQQVSRLSRMHVSRLASTNSISWSRIRMESSKPLLVPYCQGATQAAFSATTPSVRLA